MLTRHGATLSEWDQFDLVLGLTEDLLPVVSDTTAKISPLSKMAAIGKTPSIFNRKGEVSGISGWTSYLATADNVASWREQPAYGICLQTRRIRAIDVDIPDAKQARQIAKLIEQHLGMLPVRMRSNSSKFLVLIDMPGEFYKRVVKTSTGVVEFLANGQQCVVAGTHTSGERYQFAGQLPDVIPVITAEKFLRFWKALEDKFAVAPSTESKAPSKALKLAESAKNDPVAVRLEERGLILSQAKDGRLDVVCPFTDGHSGETAESSTSYYPQNTGGFARGHWHCLHASCQQRTDAEFNYAIGISIADEFDVIEPFDDQSQSETDQSKSAQRFTFSPAHEFAKVQTSRYLIKGLIPEADLGVLFGASGSGKTFAVLDIAASIARGVDWRGLRTHGGRVAYVCAEGANFFKGRLVAYASHHGVPLKDIDLHILGNAPNLTNHADTQDLINGIRQLGAVRLVVVDTLSQALAGADENSGVDMGQALAHCRAITRLTGAMVLLVHHSGKDASKGSRGWSGLRAACDVELEVLRNENVRSIRVSKQKDGDDSLEYGFALKTVNIGLDEDDEVITSCVIEHKDAMQTGTTRRALKSEKEKLVYRLVCEMVRPGGAGVSTGKLVDAAVLQIPYDEHGGKRDQRRRDVLRALDGVKAAGWVTYADGELNVTKGEAE